MVRERLLFVPLIGAGGVRRPVAGRPRQAAARYTRPAMTHVFVAPHPDDVALSCGGLIASLRELGQNVTILTVYSGTGRAIRLTPYQREALGFGNKAIWPVTEAFNRANIPNDYGVGGDEAPWAATDRQLDATQTDADAGRPALLAALIVVSPRDIHNASRPASRSSTTSRTRARS